MALLRARPMSALSGGWALHKQRQLFEPIFLHPLDDGCPRHAQPLRRTASGWHLSRRFTRSIPRSRTRSSRRIASGAGH